PYGFHVFKVVDKKPARNRSLEESRKEIHSRLLEKAREQAFRQWLAGIKTKAKIKISYDVLEKIH
ncbi:MAG: peptidylprolyl isomerase, partial [Nitrospinaceae bacterium]